MKPSEKLFWKESNTGDLECTSGDQRGEHEAGGRPLPRGPLGHRLAWIFLRKNHIYSKKISVSFYPIWTPFDMDLLRTKNMQQTGTGTGHWINMLVPKIV